MTDKATRQEIAFAMRDWITDAAERLKGDRSEWAKAQRRILTKIDEMSDAIYDGRIADIRKIGA